MMKRLKLWWKQATCDHVDASMRRWHWVHDPDFEPIHIEAEYICNDCKKKIYVHLYGSDADLFVEFAPQKEYDIMPGVRG